VKVARLVHCLMPIVGLVAAITIRQISDGDNNIVSIKLELSGVIFLPRGHYSTLQRMMLLISVSIRLVTSSAIISKSCSNSQLPVRIIAFEVELLR
jgi:hypothetical protein